MNYSKRIASHNSSTQGFSKSLFGNRHFLAVAQLIADNYAVFTVRELAAELRLADAVVKQVVVRLGNADVIEQLPQSGRAVYFERRRHAFWNLIKEVHPVSRSEVESEVSAVR